MTPIMPPEASGRSSVRLRAGPDPPAARRISRPACRPSDVYLLDLHLPENHAQLAFLERR
ncbi:hypothetical protein [Streptomyces sp. NBC_00076]|uniref:hypothetical protein n=1 Tax=Streptomyces sp. NBC_00076 TaxID=2975642 RepID=UPI003255269F